MVADGKLFIGYSFRLTKMKKFYICYTVKVNLIVDNTVHFKKFERVNLCRIVLRETPVAWW